MNGPTRAGFTLVELLVVVAIIVLLVALLAPALDKAFEAALRAQCAAHLHVWGVAINQYAMDHRRKVLSTIRLLTSQGDVYPYANCVWARATYQPGDATQNPAGTAKGDDLSAAAFESYVGGVHREQTAPGGALARVTFRGVWYCPANGADAKKDDANAQSISVNDWFAMGYAYYARADIWGGRCASRPQDLTDKELTSAKLLMADAMYWYGPTVEQANGWWYNHGEEGASAPDPSWGSPVQKNTPLVTGGNRLWGDVAVSWKDKTREDRQRMFNLDSRIGFVNTQPTMAKGPNVNFY